jgi:hypothetical protein
MFALTLATVALGSLALAVGSHPASAQIPPPPVLVYGTVDDEAGDIPAGVPVLAFIGDVECTSGTHATGKTGEGSARVTTYALDVFVDGHRPGCAQPGSVVRIKVGDRFAGQTARITDEIVYRVNVLFGDVTPAPIPTFTPTPVPAATATPTPGAGANPGDTGTASAAQTATAGAAEGATASIDPTLTVSATPPSGASPTAEDEDDVVRVPGGSTTPALGDSQTATPGGGDSFPVWAAVLLGVGALAAIGGGVGYYIYRASGASGAPPAAS